MRPTPLALFDGMLAGGFLWLLRNEGRLRRNQPTPPLQALMRRPRHVAGAVLALAMVAGGMGRLRIVTQAAARAAAPTKAQAGARAAYDTALREFKTILAKRRAQIDAKQELPNLPGQVVYLARLNVMSTYKDLTDALPSRIGRPNKFGVPAAYFDADIEPLIEEYSALFRIMQAPPAGVQASETPFKDVADLGRVIARQGRRCRYRARARFEEIKVQEKARAR